MSDKTVGPYRVVDQLGAGGMGEVYRARDSKLNRDVAIKILPPSFAADPERVARFEREAQVLAALNHPNIAAIYGFEGGSSGEPQALVMELVSGPTLAELIASAGAPARGLPLADALAMARQLVDALEAAHERGIIHRDLKPANIKVREDGTVKVLDFGLAKALDAGSGSGEADPMNSPTLTARSTQLGLILGTAAYMSPEQAKGRPVDKRADIWAFGAVLYEMLSGRRAFAGEDVSDTLASVLRAEVDWSALPVDTPVAVRRLLERCLERDLKRRLRDIGDARFDLDPRESAGSSGVTAPLPAAVAPARGWAIRLLPWAAGFVIATAGVTWGLTRAAAPVRSIVTRAETHESELELSYSLSHDGTRLTYSLIGGQGSAAVGMREMNEFTGKAVSGATGAFSFFSPDGQWIGYMSLQSPHLLKIPAAGGTPTILCEGSVGGGADWGPDDTIIFASSKGLMRVSAAGGQAEALTTVDAKRGESAHSRPFFLPGGKRVLFTVTTTASGDQFAVLDLATHAYRTVAPGGDNGQYQQSGHLTYLRDTTLYAVPFDLASLAVTGPEVPVVEGVSTVGPDGTADYTVSDSGLLVYGRQEAGQGTTLAWADRKGVTTPLPGDSRAAWGTGRLAPDGNHVADTIRGTGAANDVWVADVVRGTSMRLTTSGVAQSPVWMPDGRRLIYAGVDGGKPALFTVAADDSGKPEVLAVLETSAVPVAVSPDGQTLLFLAPGPDHKRKLMVLPLNPTGTPHAWHDASAAEDLADFSPDGRWVAYETSQSGGFDVYVEAASGTGARTRVSDHGGTMPRWSRTGRELFFWQNTPASVLRSVAVPAGPDFHPGPVTDVTRVLSGTTWDVTPDPNRFLVELTTPTGGTVVAVVTNWFDELRRLAPPRR